MVEKGFTADLVPDSTTEFGYEIKGIHDNSDNAAQHFKSTGALSMFAEMAMNLNPETHASYCFGCPGHGVRA
jgi:hypothetical protein